MRMNPVVSPEKQRPLVANLIAGALGGLIVLVIGAVLIATDVIDTGDTTNRVVRQAPISQPASDPSRAGEGRTVQDIYRQEGRGVVYIQAEGVTSDQSLFGTPQQGTATGSGFVVDKDGTIITNAHVVEGANQVTVSFEESGDSIEADVRGVDADTDLAVLKVDPSEVENLTVLPLGESSSLEVGDPVVAIGNPFGLQRTVTTGIVSALQRQIDAPSGFSISNVIQTDASINPGNSGGPLLDAQGRVIGINSQIATGGGQGSVGIGFAVPIDTAKDLLPKLRQGRDIERAYLGVQMADVTSDVASDLDLPVDHGALIQSVENGSPADDAGLRAGDDQTSGGITAGGDLIVSVDGKEIDSAQDVVSAVGGKQPGDKIEIEYYRGDDKRSAEVELTERPEQLSSSPQQQEEPQSPDENDEGLPFDLP
jgi:S1-C subfamily serine protease